MATGMETAAGKEITSEIGDGSGMGNACETRSISKRHRTFLISWNDLTPIGKKKKEKKKKERMKGSRERGEGNDKGRLWDKNGGIRSKRQKKSDGGEIRQERKIAILFRSHFLSRPFSFPLSQPFWKRPSFLEQFLSLFFRIVTSAVLFPPFLFLGYFEWYIDGVTMTDLFFA